MVKPIGKYGEVYGAEMIWDQCQGRKGEQFLFYPLEELPEGVTTII